MENEDVVSEMRKEEIMERKGRKGREKNRGVTKVTGRGEREQ